LFVLAGCGGEEKRVATENSRGWQARAVEKYGGVEPEQWGENLEGVFTRINTEEKIIALTLDACGGRYDKELIEMLRRLNVPATLFISGGWIESNRGVFKQLAGDTLFGIANHGYSHRPLSVNGRSVYGIKGTSSVREAVAEIYKNQRLIKKLSGNEPKFFRPGTAYFDEVAIEIVYEAGLKPVNYTIAGDQGGTAGEKEIISALGEARPGDILLFHMNLPDSVIARGLEAGIGNLREKGFEFVRLGDYEKRLE
jgi:peptidoglycan/xylan/chitin deacetylase (PgdA/CDA1 family)